MNRQLKGLIKSGQYRKALRVRVDIGENDPSWKLLDRLDGKWRALMDRSGRPNKQDAEFSSEQLEEASEALRHMSLQCRAVRWEYNRRRNAI